MLIRIPRVFNGAKYQTHTDNTVTLSNFNPAVYTPPLTYISASFNGEANITSQTVSPLNNTTRSRVQLSYDFPVTVTYTDAAGIRGSASGTIPASIDLLLTLPDKPYTFEVSVAYESRIGSITINGDTVTASVTACFQTVVRVLVMCEVLINPRGCANFPDALLTENAVCNAVFTVT